MRTRIAPNTNTFHTVSFLFQIVSWKQSSLLKTEIPFKATANLKVSQVELNAL